MDGSSHSGVTKAHASKAKHEPLEYPLQKGYERGWGVSPLFLNDREPLEQQTE